ncbi:MAG: hypothetical protein ABIH76_05495 [Candidatus Bathyarchaeota archaeon]
MKSENPKCHDDQCVCKGSGNLRWAVDLNRWRHQLLCDQGGLIFMEVEDEIEVYDYVGDTFGLKGNPVRNAPPTPSLEDYIRCTRCNRLILKSGHYQKFCPMCTKLSRATYKREWIRKKREELKNK